MSIKMILQCNLCKTTEMDEPIPYHIWPLEGKDRDTKHLCEECGEFLIRSLKLLGIKCEVIPLEKGQANLFPARIKVLLNVPPDSDN